MATKVDWSPSKVRPIAYGSSGSCLVLSGSDSLIPVPSFRFCSDWIPSCCNLPALGVDEVVP